MKIKHTPGASAHLLKAMREIAEKQARVGFFESAKYPDGTPVAYVATIQEFGHGAIPPRPFMRPTIEQQKAAWQQTLRDGYRAVLNNRLTAEAMLQQFGMQAAGDVRQTIAAVTAPPLKQSTLDARQSRKKTPGVSQKPLVDTGLLIQSVTSDVATSIPN